MSLDSMSGCVDIWKAGLLLALHCGIAIPRHFHGFIFYFFISLSEQVDVNMHLHKVIFPVRFL